MSKLRENLARLDYEFGTPKAYFNWDMVNSKDKTWYLKKADQIIAAFKEHGGVLLAKDQELPIYGHIGCHNDYLKAQQDMLKAKFQRIEEIKL